MPNRMGSLNIVYNQSMSDQKSIDEKSSTANSERRPAVVCRIIVTGVRANAY